MSEPKDELHLNLNQQKTRAKELRDAVREGNQDAVARILRHHPKADAVDAADVALRFGRLSDAQLVIARELGLASWPKLKAHVEQLDRARAAIESGAAAPDAGRATLHIRCGGDIRDPLKEAGFVGEFLEFSDPLCLGPVPRDGDLLRIRARFLAEDFDVAAEDIAADYSRILAKLRHAPEQYERIVLWFEHDSYDQLILARTLSVLGEPRMKAAPEMICIDRFPGIKRFVGLGQLSPAALRLLWESRAPVTPAQLRLGAAVWNALREPSPAALHAIAVGGTPELPVMAPALTRHLQELPWTQDGLSLTQHLVLQQLKSGPQSASALFKATQEKLEPLPFLGDAMFWAELRNLQKVARPPFEVTSESAKLSWPKRALSLNALGEALLAGRLDWLSLIPQERWVGGVRIVAGDRAWRWAGDQHRPVQR